MVKFCDNCGSLMMPTKEKDGVQLLCKKCEISVKAEYDIVLKTKMKQEDRTTTVVISKKEQEHATEEMHCPDCNKMRKITQWQVQTRSADEAPTTFYKCQTCQNTWRDYGG